VIFWVEQEVSRCVRVRVLVLPDRPSTDLVTVPKAEEADAGCLQSPHLSPLIFSPSVLQVVEIVIVITIHISTLVGVEEGSRPVWSEHERPGSGGAGNRQLTLPKLGGYRGIPTFEDLGSAAE